MSKRVLLCLSHSIEEYQQLDLLHGLGYEVASIGGYIDPAHPHDGKRPALVHVPMVPEVKSAVDALGTPDNLGSAQTNIPTAILDWLGDDGIIIYHHYLARLFAQWARITDWKKGSSSRRVIWRSVGQSVTPDELQAQWYRRQGLERIAYSPKERNIPGYSGDDALIRFWVDPDEWSGWHGAIDAVTNVTQRMFQRGSSCNPGYWKAATRLLPAMPIGEGSEEYGGAGMVTYAEMQLALRSYRAYLYTGTQPASYTLGFIEAMMTGIPVVSIGPRWMSQFSYGPDLFEGSDLAPLSFDEPDDAHEALRKLLNDPEYATTIGARSRDIAYSYFNKQDIGEQWKAYLG